MKQLHIPEYGPPGAPSWQLWIVAASLLLFQGTIVDKRFQASTDGSIDAMNEFLTDVGCPACANVALYKLVIRVLRKGLDHALAVSKQKIQDDEWQRWITA